MLNETFTLNNGIKIPKIGLGTWLIDNNKVRECVKDAIEVGYRHIDTAQAYENEEGVGLGIKDSGIAREEIFVTSKVAAEAKTYEDATNSINETLRKMGIDYLDLMIIHSPQPWAEFREDSRYFEENKEVWRALEDAYKEGKLKAIGVSNFLQDDLENILNSCEIKPMVNQILTHISNTKFELIDFCKKNDILVEAYSPIAHGALMKNEKIMAIAEKYGVSIPQICIRYVLQLDLVALPKTETKKYMIENGKVDFEISQEDMETLKSIEHIKDYGEDHFFPVFSKN